MATSAATPNSWWKLALVFGCGVGAAVALYAGHSALAIVLCMVGSATGLARRRKALDEAARDMTERQRFWAMVNLYGGVALLSIVVVALIVASLSGRL